METSNDIHLRGPWAKLAAGLMLAGLVGGAALVVRMDVRLTQLEQKHEALVERVVRERESTTGIWAQLGETNKRLGEIERAIARVEGRLGEQ